LDRSTVNGVREIDVNGLRDHFPHWEKTKVLIDQVLDITLNYRQSGHPGGSRSKVHMLLSLMLSGSMRWDIRRPDKRFGDKFVLGAGHTIPLIYCTLAILNEALRVKHEQTGESKYAIYMADERALYWEDLLGFRRRGGLSGHAESSGKTLFLKANTGPSGHGTPTAAGIALALKRAGAKGVRVFIVEGEGGLTTGVTHETLNNAWGLSLDNLHFLVDWNDFGIDDHSVSTVVYGTPRDWFESHGWCVYGTDNGSDWEEVTQTLSVLVGAGGECDAPSMGYFKTRKGREYLKYDFASHGAPHPMNSENYWTLRKQFASTYGAKFQNVDGAAPAGAAAVESEFRANLGAVIEVMHQDQALVDYLADRLVDIGDGVPDDIPGFKLGRKPGVASPFDDKAIRDFENYPAELYLAPGKSAANRAALGAWGAWINSYGAEKYGRPVFLASSADLAGSTNIKGFGDGFGGFKGYGWYERKGTADGALLPCEITEFANIGMLAGVAITNLAADPETAFDGFWGATSTYGSFSYLMYGPMRLFSQYAQDTDLKMGKLIYVAGHSGPETADDSRTHFGIFSPGVTQLFPKGKVINLYPYEYNEVMPLLGAALGTGVPLLVLHLTRPPIQIPDRAALGMPSHFAAARGAYIARDYQNGAPQEGTVFVQGTSAANSVVKLLPRLAKDGPNVKIVFVPSPDLFAMQPEPYRSTVVTPGDRADSTVITTQARKLLSDFIFNSVAEEYAISSDFDNRWRTGGTLDEVLDEARLTPEWIYKGIQRFTADRSERLARLRNDIADAR
jgi:transketolase